MRGHGRHLLEVLRALRALVDLRLPESPFKFLHSSSKFWGVQGSIFQHFFDMIYENIQEQHKIFYKKPK